jgi:hypothetical protein
VKIRNTYLLKEQLTKKLINQALFSENIFTKLTALMLLSQKGDPEIGWLLETLIENERVFKFGPR